MDEGNKITIEEATAFIKEYEKEQSELCQKEIEEVLKNRKRKLVVVLSMDENETILKTIALAKL